MPLLHGGAVSTVWALFWLWEGFWCGMIVARLIMTWTDW